jgi:CheY-like chemotaxis protein
MAIMLVVDDHVIDRELLVILLGYYGHRMPEAGDGTEALQRVPVQRPNLSISDILMPTTHGYEFVWELRADPSIANTAIIFYEDIDQASAYARQEAPMTQQDVS